MMENEKQVLQPRKCYVKATCCNEGGRGNRIIKTGLVADEQGTKEENGSQKRVSLHPSARHAITLHHTTQQRVLLA